MCHHLWANKGFMACTFMLMCSRFIPQVSIYALGSFLEKRSISQHQLINYSYCSKAWVIWAVCRGGVGWGHKSIAIWIWRLRNVLSGTRCPYRAEHIALWSKPFCKCSHFSGLFSQNKLHLGSWLPENQRIMGGGGWKGFFVLKQTNQPPNWDLQVLDDGIWSW